MAKNDVVNADVDLDAAPSLAKRIGAEVFGTYPAGEPLDPVTLTLPEGDCGAVGVSEVEAAGDTGPVDGVPAWIGWLIVGLLLAAIAATAAVLLVRRRRR